MAVDSSEKGQNAYSISVFPDEYPKNLLCESKLGISGIAEALTSLKNPILDHQSNCQTSLQMEKDHAHSPRVVVIDIEKGNSKTPTTTEENGIGLKAEGSLTLYRDIGQHLQRAMHRELSFYIGGKLMQFFINHVLVLLKFTSRDKSTIERKYKRSASFNSRKIALLFSVMSSMGTMILIYLTLRVRHMG